jgi:purine-binding chemotaxis protein CheW
MKPANSEKVDEYIDIEAAKESVADSDVLQFVSFLIEETEYAVDILVVNEILRYPEITRLPNTPFFIRGVINLRGNVIPVIDVRLRFGFAKGNITDLTRVIVIDTGGKQIGLLVDSVYQVVRIPSAQIDPPTEIITGVSEKFIFGIGRFHERLVILLKMSYLVFLEEKDAFRMISSSDSDNQ